MKVVYIHHATGFGGSSKSLGLIIKELINLGIEAHIICPKGGAEKYFKTVTDNVYPLTHRAFPLTMTVAGMKGNRFHFYRNHLMIPNVTSVIDIVKNINPDLVHLNEVGLTYVAKAIHKLKIPIIAHARTMPHKGYKGINKFALRGIEKYCKHIICITGSVSNWIKTSVPKSIIYNPVEVIPPAKQRNIAFPLNLLSLSALQRSKGVFDIVEAAKTLEHDDRFLFKIAGKINRSNKSGLSPKQKILAFLGFIDFSDNEKILEIVDGDKPKNVEFLDHINNINSLFEDTDILLAPMHLNAPPRSVYEAGIFGIPSILSMEDKMHDVVTNNENGILIDEEAPDQIVSSLLYLADNPNIINEFGIKSRERFAKNHKAILCAQQVLAIYKNITKP